MRTCKGVVSRALRAESEATRQEIGLEDRLRHELQRRLHDAVADRRYRERAPLRPAGLGYPHPPARLHPVAPLPQFRGQFIEQTVHAVALDLGKCDAVDAGCAAVAAHLPPRALQHVPAVDFVVERVKASPGLGLGRPVQRAL